MADREGASVYLLEFLVNPAPRGPSLPPLALQLRYLITTWSADVATAHRLIGELTFAALAGPDIEVEPTPVPAALWQAFGLAPRPALVLRVPVTRARPATVAPRVRERVTVRFDDGEPLQGCLLGPGRTPIMAATIILPSLKLSTQTDNHGRFLFAKVPRDPPVTELQISTRGRTIVLPVQSPPSSPLLIELNERQI